MRPSTFGYGALILATGALFDAVFRRSIVRPAWETEAALAVAWAVCAGCWSLWRWLSGRYSIRVERRTVQTKAYREDDDGNPTDGARFES